MAIKRGLGQVLSHDWFTVQKFVENGSALRGEERIPAKFKELNQHTFLVLSNIIYPLTTWIPTAVTIPGWAGPHPWMVAEAVRISPAVTRNGEHGPPV